MTEKMRPCPYCRRDASLKAVFCPWCRHRLIDRNGNVIPVLVALFVFLVVFFGHC